MHIRSASEGLARAALPFFACLVVLIAAITLFPGIATGLPNLLMGVER
jgi:TRAP-type C4-dicarboxylate transport system permease large subunit